MNLTRRLSVLLKHLNYYLKSIEAKTVSIQQLSTGLLSVFALLVCPLTQCRALALSPRLHKNTTGVLQHNQADLQLCNPLALVLPSAPYASSILCDGFLISLHCTSWVSEFVLLWHVCHLCGTVVIQFLIIKVLKYSKTLSSSKWK